MIPLSPGDVAKMVEAAGTIINFIERAKNPNRLGDFAKLMSDTDTDKRATEIRQFLQDLMQERGFTPWYSWTQGVDIPKDMLCDLVDLLISGTTTRQKGGWLGSLLGSDQGDVVKQAWAKVIAAVGDATLATPDQTRAIISVLTGIIVNCGRCRAYDGKIVETMDLDLLADVGMALLG